MPHKDLKVLPYLFRHIPVHTSYMFQVLLSSLPTRFVVFVCLNILCMYYQNSTGGTCVQEGDAMLLLRNYF